MLVINMGTEAKNKKTEAYIYLEIVDLVRVPASLAPGNYMLQWRWDCEESDQVWASCADIEVIV